MKKSYLEFLALTVLLAVLAVAGCSREEPDEVATGRSGAAGSESLEGPEVLVFSGLEELMAWLEEENWWGETAHDQQLTAPHLIITAINPSWQISSQQLTVEDKKELFYRLMLPLVMHANGMALDFRAGLQQAQLELEAGGQLSPESLALLERLAILLPDTEAQYAAAESGDAAAQAAIIDELLYRVDVVPAGLALGQAAYESGYGTSRFAVEGNSLFGQWTYKGDGIVPGKQRKHLGNHQIKAFDWPFDSVRGYFINLMSHPAYEDFRRLRAERRAAGESLDSLSLADGLVKYSERGQDYVDSLKGMIRVNRLQVADNAVFRDEPLRFIVTEQDPEDAEQLRADIEGMRASGELNEIIARMRLD